MIIDQYSIQAPPMHDGIHRNLIGGEWVQADADSENRSPSDLSDLVGVYAQASIRDVDAAVEAARVAHPGWVNAGIQARSELLEKVGLALEARRLELGRVLAREEGKTLVEAAAEVTRAGQIFRYFSGEALRLYGVRLDSVRPGVDVEVVREPLGVVGLITPWNFPIAIPAWKMAPALAFGNTVVIKPADLTPASVHLLVQILVECGCPRGVVNLVMGQGRLVGQAIVEHAGVDAVSFTGSVTVGRQLIARCATAGKKVQAEMGGKNPMVVLSDADLDVAVAACVNAAFGSTGQRCTATSRIIVTKGIVGQFSDKLEAAMRKLRVGHALDAGTQIGPVVSETQLRSNLAYVELARQEGAEVIGGGALELDPRGYYQQPALFLQAQNAMRTSQEEIFGPCASVIEARDFDHALHLANDTAFGLSAGICTSSLKYASEFKRRARAGMVMVNLPTAGVDYHVPFGGSRGSSYGSREQGYAAADFYTTLKTSYTLPT